MKPDKPLPVARTPAVPPVSSVRAPEARTSRPQTLWIEAGAVRLYNAADINGRGLISGWGPPEDRHTWNDGITAIQQIGMMREPTGPMTLTVEGVPYVLESHKQQEVTLYGNGFHLGFWRLTERRLMTLAARVEPEQWFVRRGLAHLRLTWILPNSVRPCDVNDGPDTRTLGLTFGTLTIAEIQDE